MLHRLEFRAMGCEMLAIVDVDGPVPRLLQDVPAWFEDWEQSLSRFRPESELSRLNRSSAEMPVSETLWNVFQLALTVDRLTGGLVTPLVYDALIQAGYNRSFDSLPRDQIHGLTELALPGALSETVLWDEASRTIFLPPGAHLDLGGVAKGWAAHQAMERLRVAGPALMDAAGDIAVSGPQLNGELWPLGVANPFDPEGSILTLGVAEGGVATSGRDRRKWMQNGQARHHIIDPRTGLPAITDVMTATVIAPTVMEAEAAAKTAFLMGCAAGLDWIDRRPELAGLLVMEDGRVEFTRNMQNYL